MRRAVWPRHRAGGKRPRAARKLGFPTTTDRRVQPETKLPKVGTTIFTVMSQLAAEHGAVNLGQGFPDFPVPERLVEALDRAMRAGHNQYAMMTGIPALRQAIADKTERVYGWKPDAD